MSAGRTDVAAYWKKGNRPEDQMSKSRLRPSTYKRQLRVSNSVAHPNHREHLIIHVKCHRVHARGQGGVQTLCETLGDDELARDFRVRRRWGLQSLSC